MPFHDREWEDLQRDYDIFPAYSDFIYGPDERLVVTQEPGLHPMIYPMDPSAPVRYTNSMPSRSWSYKTTAAAQMLSLGQNELINSQMSATNSVRSTPGLYVRSQNGSPMGPLLPPQGVRTVSEKEMAQRNAFNTLQRRALSNTVVPLNAPQQQQSVRLPRQHSQARNTPVVHRSDVQPQQPSFLRSSSTTDIDENPAQIASRQKPGILSPYASRAMMLPPPAYLHQQQPERATDLHSDWSSNPAPNPSPRSSQQNPLLQPDDMYDPRYDCFDYGKRKEIIDFLNERWDAVRDSPDNALRAKALSDIQNATRTVNTAVLNMYAAAESERMRAQWLQGQRDSEAQARLIHQIPQYQHTHQYSHVVAQPQLQSGVSPFQPVQPLPTQSLQQPAHQEPYYTIPQASSQIQPPPQTLPQYHQAHYQPQQQIQEQHYSSPNQISNPSPTPPQASAELRANIDRHLPQAWQTVLIVRNEAQTQQNRENAHRWMTEFKNSLPEEGRRYLLGVLGRAVAELNAGRDAMAFITSWVSRPR